jgi:hypothetical protein
MQDKSQMNDQDNLKKQARLMLIVSSVLLILVAPALLVALVMSLAAPGGPSLFAVVVAGGLTALPYLMIVTAWILYFRSNYRWADLCAKAPVALFLILVVVSTGATVLGSILGFPTMTTKTYGH